MNDGQNINLIRLYSINTSVGLFNQFPDIIGIIFRDLAARLGMGGYLDRALSDFINSSFGVGWGIGTDVLINIYKMTYGILGPVDFHYASPNL